MPTEIARPALSLSLLFLVAALICFVIGLIVVHSGADFGKPLEWLFGGLIFSTLAKIL
jgi:hypothetical protein